MHVNNKDELNEMRRRGFFPKILSGEIGESQENLMRGVFVHIGVEQRHQQHRVVRLG